MNTPYTPRVLLDTAISVERGTHHAREPFKTLLEHAPIGIVLVGPDLRLREANRCAMVTFREHPQPLGSHFAAVLGAARTAAETDKVVSLFRHTLATGETCVAHDWSSERKDGVTERYDWQIHRIELSGGGFGVVCYFRDTSAELQVRQGIIAAQKDVQRSEVRYRRLFETAHDGILLLDAATARITDANPFITALLGYAHGDLLGKELWQIGLFADIEASKAAMRELQDKHFIRYENLPLQTRSGECIELEFVSNLYNEGDQQVIQCNIRDVTARKKLEGELRQRSDELVDADRRKNEFLAMLAHELRNPLAPIRNALKVMRVSAGDELAVRSATAMMERQVGQMVRLVDDLLDASRVSRGIIELKRERVELTSAIFHAIEAARPLVDELGHTLRVEMSSDPIWLHADTSRLAQIVGNLLNNACKFTDRGGLIVLAVERDRDSVLIKVRDNGIGLSTEQLPRIFDMFMQVDTSLGRSVSGLGIGLALVKNLVLIHDGTLTVQSDGIGCGSEFIVRLPTSPRPGPQPPSAAVGKPIVHGRVRRILVVDDNRDSAESLAQLLDLWRFETTIAYDGMQAVALAESFNPDVVLLDIGLPKLNGYGVARRIRSQPWGRDMRLVALSGWGRGQDPGSAAEAGFDQHLVKPVDPDVLLHLLSTMPAPLASS